MVGSTSKAGLRVLCGVDGRSGRRRTPCSRGARPYVPPELDPIWSRARGQDMQDWHGSRDSTPEGHDPDERWMRRALDLAARGPQVDPNPRVGCVVVSPQGEVVGEGWHRGAGTPHAEVVALESAGDAARGTTAYVSLEPCAHTGRTGPCAQALHAAGVTRVVHAQTDPNPVAAGGADWLREHGVDVRGGVLAEEATALNRTWTHLATTGFPWVTWKLATTLDGRSAAADGTSRWITSEAARQDVHRLRSECGA